MKHQSESGQAGAAATAPVLLSITAAAAKLGVDRSLVAAAVAANRLPAVTLKPGGRPRIPAAALERWLESAGDWQQAAPVTAPTQRMTRPALLRDPQYADARRRLGA